VEGDAAVTDTGTGDRLDLPQGTSALVPASVRQYRIEGEAHLYKATVPLRSGLLSKCSTTC
jgi:mannose-6-phosphate isomerase class I